MSHIAPWLVAATIAAPLLAAFAALMARGMANRVARLGLAGSAGSAACLLGLLIISDTASVTVGPWLTVAGRLSLEWGLHVDRSAAIWIAVLTGVTWLAAWSSARSVDDPADAAFPVTSALVVAAATGVIASPSLVQLQVCWWAVSFSCLMMAAWSSPQLSIATDSPAARNSAAMADWPFPGQAPASPVQGMRQATQAALAGDLLLLWSMLLVVQSGGSFSFAGLRDGPEQVEVANAALPGVAGSLLVLSVLGRCGLFPAFNWHSAAKVWDPRMYLMIYGVGFVPSGLWLLLKCQPLLASSEIVLELLSGLGTLAAALGAFVACGQCGLHSRLAYVFTSQIGVLLAAVGSGHESSIGLCVWHLSAAALAMFVLVGGITAGSVDSGPGASNVEFQRPARATGRRIAAWCAALSVAGFAPFAGGRLYSATVELNVRPVVRIVSSGTAPEETVDAMHPANRLADPILMERRPGWKWICGLWLAQTLSAFAIGAVLSNPAPADTGASPRRFHMGERSALVAAAALILAGGLWGWLSPAPGPDARIRMLVGQAAGLIGLAAGSLAARVKGTSDGVWQPIARLARERLYVEHVWTHVWRRPSALFDMLFTQWLGIAAVDRGWNWFSVRAVAWLGTHVETLHVSRADFYVAAFLLGTIALLLTLVLGN